MQTLVDCKPTNIHIRLYVHGSELTKMARLHNQVILIAYLISSDKVHNNTGIGKVDEPVRFIESKTRQNVPRCVIPKGRITKASTREVEEGGN